MFYCQQYYRTMICDYLCNRPEFIDTLAEHLWQEWSEDYISFTSSKTLNKLKEYYTLLKIGIPTCHVIYEANTLLGACLIADEDMQVRPELKPWLACLYVLPAHRNKKVASCLLSYVLPKYPILYLWTYTEELAEFYIKFGFVQKEVIAQHGHYQNIIVMGTNKETNHC